MRSREFIIQIEREFDWDGFDKRNVTLCRVAK